MFGTVARIRPIPGQEQALFAIEEEWAREEKDKIKGAIGGYIFKSEKNPGEYIMVAIFEDRESYYANANDPMQDRRYRRMRELMVDDPDWEDGEIVSHF